MTLRWWSLLVPCLLTLFSQASAQSEIFGGRLFPSFQLTGTVNVKADFGALGDGKSNVQSGADGAISSGTKILTSTHVDSGFVTGDVGKRIVVYGAGAGGTDLYTTVAGVISTTAIILTDAASTTVSGVTIILGSDDTVKFQNAFTSANLIDSFTQPPGGTKLGSSTCITIPKGIYILSATILPANAFARICGQGHPLLVMMDQTKNIIDFAFGYNVTIDDVGFIGGASQVRFGNNNLDSSTFICNRCDFFRNYTAPALDFYATSGSSLSVVATIMNSRFINPYQVVSTVAGVAARFTDTWVEVSSNGIRPPSQIDGALFINKGQMIFDNMYGVPNINSGTSVGTNNRWVDNYGTLIANNSRFGAEGAGMPIVYNFCGPSTAYSYNVGTQNGVPCAIQITNSVVGIGASGAANRGVVNFRTDIPQSIIILNNTALTQDSDSFINTGLVNIAAYLSALNANDRIYIRVKGNQCWVPCAEGGIPAALKTTAPTQVYLDLDETVGLVNQVPFKNSQNTNTFSSAMTFNGTSLKLGTGAGDASTAPIISTGTPDARYGALTLNNNSSNFMTFMESGVGGRGAIGFNAGSGTMLFKTQGGIDNGTVAFSIGSGIATGTATPGAAGTIQWGSFLFINIGTVLTANGQMGYCSDCDPATAIDQTCTSAGAKTGNLAMRINGVNKCAF